MRAFATLAILFGLAAPATAETLRIGTDPTFAPYIFQKGGRLAGMDKDVMDEVCRRAALDCAWSTTTFDNLIPALRAGHIDLAVAGMANSAKRRKLVDFSRVYSAASGASLYAGLPGARSPGSARIGVKAGTIHAEHLAAQGRKARTYRTEVQALDALMAGEIDLFFGSNSYLLEARTTDRRGWDILYEETVAAEGAAIALRKGDAALRSRIDGALAAMEADGTLRRLDDKWFD